MAEDRGSKPFLPGFGSKSDISGPLDGSGVKPFRPASLDRPLNQPPSVEQRFSHRVNQTEHFVLDPNEPLSTRLGDGPQDLSLTFTAAVEDGRDVIHVAIPTPSGDPQMQTIQVSSLPGPFPRVYGIGRDSSTVLQRLGVDANAITIPQSYNRVSRAHMRISAVKYGDKIIMQLGDLNSSNGTFTNREPAGYQELGEDFSAVQRVNRAYQGGLGPVIDQFLATGQLDDRLLTHEEGPLFTEYPLNALGRVPVTRERSMREVFSRGTELGTCYLFVRTNHNEPINIVKLSYLMNGKVSIETTGSKTVRTLNIDQIPNLPRMGGQFRFDEAGIAGQVVDGVLSREGAMATIHMAGIDNQNPLAVSLSELFTYIQHMKLNAQGLPPQS